MEKTKKFKKSKEFLSSVPEWEKDYKKSEDVQIKFEKKDWKSAKAVFTKNDLKILGYSVMEDWETPYMKELAAISCSGGGGNFRGRVWHGYICRFYTRP